MEDVRARITLQHGTPVGSRLHGSLPVHAVSCRRSGAVEFIDLDAHRSLILRRRARATSSRDGGVKAPFGETRRVPWRLAVVGWMLGDISDFALLSYGSREAAHERRDESKPKHHES